MGVIIVNTMCELLSTTDRKTTNATPVPKIHEHEWYMSCVKWGSTNTGWHINAHHVKKIVHT